MADTNEIMRFEGDIRMWAIDENGDETPVIEDATDAFGNLPLEVSGMLFAYEDGEEQSIVTKRRDVYGQVIWSEKDPGVSNASFTFAAFPPAILALVFRGSAVEVSVTGAAVTGESVTFAADAPSQQLAHRYLAASPAPVVESMDGLTTYTSGTDYTIDLRNGRIVRLAGGTIGATASVNIDYTYTSYEVLRVRGGVKPQQRFRVVGDLKNRSTGRDLKLDIWDISLSPDGDVDLFASEPISLTAAGPMATPQGKTEPYLVDYTR